MASVKRRQDTLQVRQPVLVRSCGMEASPGAKQPQRSEVCGLEKDKVMCRSEG